MEERTEHDEGIREDEPGEGGPRSEDIAGGPVGNSNARFVAPTQEAEEEAREDVQEPGSTGSVAADEASDASRP